MREIQRRVGRILLKVWEPTKVGTVERTIFSAEHDAFRALAREFLQQHVVPHHDAWEREGIAPREALALAGRSGLVGFNIPEEYGGGGVPDDFRFNAVVAEEMARAAVHAPGLTLNNDIIAPYLRDLANDEQRGRWLKPFASGELLVAIAMTEPGAGSDLAGISTAAQKVDGGWTLSGSKTFISGGIGADCVIVVARSSAEGGIGVSVCSWWRAAPRDSPAADDSRSWASRPKTRVSCSLTTPSYQIATCSVRLAEGSLISCRISPRNGCRWP